MLRIMPLDHTFSTGVIFLGMIKMPRCFRILFPRWSRSGPSASSQLERILQGQFPDQRMWQDNVNGHGGLFEKPCWIVLLPRREQNSCCVSFHLSSGFQSSFRFRLNFVNTLFRRLQLGPTVKYKSQPSYFDGIARQQKGQMKRILNHPELLPSSQRIDSESRTAPNKRFALLCLT